MRRVILALGSNIGNLNQNFNKAVGLIGERIGAVLKESSRILTKPLLHPTNATQEQAEYLNTVLILETELAPERLLKVCHAIEKEIGRQRQKEIRRWEARIIDIDIIGIEDRVINVAGLVVPHPEMHKRTFVLMPLKEIWPDWRHPLLKKSAKKLLEQLAAQQFTGNRQ